MSDDRTHQDRLRGALFSDGKPPEPLKKDGDGGDEGSCAAFGYLRGIRDSSTSVEFRFRSGNSMWFPYSWLGPWRYDPSEGLLLKFSGDVVSLVLIKGSNLDKPLSDGSINLTSWSGRLDLNQRPPAPKAGALPGCATPRLCCCTNSKPGLRWAPCAAVKPGGCGPGIRRVTLSPL